MLSNSLESTFCIDCLQEALQKYATPKIFNTDQGAQFMSAAFIGALIELVINFDNIV
jgi:putative transposase